MSCGHEAWYYFALRGDSIMFFFLFNFRFCVLLVRHFWAYRTRPQESSCFFSSFESVLVNATRRGAQGFCNLHDTVRIIRDMNLAQRLRSFFLFALLISNWSTIFLFVAEGTLLEWSSCFASEWLEWCSGLSVSNANEKAIVSFVPKSQCNPQFLWRKRWNAIVGARS